MTTIVVSGYYGFDNAGDEAMLAAITRSIRSRWPGVDICVLSANPADTRERHGVQSVSRTDPAALTGVLRGAELLISGGGSLLQDGTSAYTVPYYLGIVQLARALNTRVMFFAQGIGPLHRTWSRQLLRAVGSRVDYITVRDRASYGLLDELGLTQQVPVEVTADAVLALTPGDPYTGRELLAAENIEVSPGGESMPLVGVSARAVDNKTGHADAIAGACRSLLERNELRFLVVPMQPSQDMSISREIARAVGERASVVRGSYTARELSSMFTHCELVIGMRLHSLILAVLVGRPVAGISYDPKIEGFLDRLELEPVAAVRPHTSPTERELAEAVAASWSRREALQKAVRANLPGLRRSAHRNFDIIGELLELPTALSKRQ